MTIDGLARTEELPSDAQRSTAADIQPWVDLRGPDPHTAVVCGTVRIVDQGARSLCFGPTRCTTAKGGVVNVDVRTGQFAYTPSTTARQVSRARTHYGDTVDTFTVDVVDHYGGRAEAHIVVEILPAEIALAGAPRNAPAQPSEGVKTSTLVGAKEVQWRPITVDSGCTLSVLSTSGGTSSLTVGGNGDYTLKFTSSGGSYFSKGPAGSVVLRVTGTHGLYTDRTYTY
ncbi:hypothetical protein [Mycolicibacterium sp. A43C]